MIFWLMPSILPDDIAVSVIISNITAKLFKLDKEA